MLVPEEVNVNNVYLDWTRKWVRNSESCAGKTRIMDVVRTETLIKNPIVEIDACLLMLLLLGSHMKYTIFNI